MDSDHSCWVTVFGFPLSLSSLILQQFESDGEILQHESGQGNWMSIRFRSPLDAKKALGKNGKIITDNIMIGVLPSDKVRIRLPMSAEGASAYPTPVYRPKEYRPATEDYVLGRTGPVMKPPQSNGSVFSTLSDYLFGW